MTNPEKVNAFLSAYTSKEAINVSEGDFGDIDVPELDPVKAKWPRANKHQMYIREMLEEARKGTPKGKQWARVMRAILPAHAFPAISKL